MKDYTNPYQTPSAQPSPGADSTAALAGRWQRLAGAIIDGLISLAIIGPMLYFSGAWANMMETGTLDLVGTLTWFIIGEVVFLAVQGYLLFNRQQTIGKWLLNMKIIGVEKDDVPAGKLYGMRYLLMHVLSQIPIINLVMIIDPLLIFRKDKRCLHDLLAGTRVIEAPQS
ncbi:RDD family protein [Alcanivorax sp. S6407]|uniref:RDD family protein n=1 Tax=Alcanivorax sp. S6407 TaxID=2926424 RepID=UPI001FF2DA14|nr:RDD family protein [Alcanivorax sp. S6407]MCK0154023.1 RDD family protein [Alcanivorax sp. S6407]